MIQADATHEQIAALIDSNSVVLFMKGDRESPRCGFSATVVRILDTLVAEYRTFDVLEDPEVREGIKQYSSWPTVPQLYVGGEFIGGCDIIQELFGSGELHEKLGVEVGAVDAPSISISDPAAQALRRAAADAPPDQSLQLSVDARYQSSLSLAPRSVGAVEVTANGVRLTMDPLTAKRAQGIRIDVQDTAGGLAFRVEIPGAPTDAGAPRS